MLWEGFNHPSSLSVLAEIFETFVEICTFYSGALIFLKYGNFELNICLRDYEYVSKKVHRSISYAP